MDPQHVETIAEKRIREAQERGEFDNLPGAGKPLPSLDRPYREDWWINGLIEREQLDMTGAMNPTMALRKEAHAMDETVRDVAREESVRAIVVSDPANTFSSTVSAASVTSGPIPSPAMTAKLIVFDMGRSYRCVPSPGTRISKFGRLWAPNARRRP